MKRFIAILPLFKREKVASFSYGLVNGKQQCHYPWNVVETWTTEPAILPCPGL